MKKIIAILLLIINVIGYSQGSQMLNDTSFSQTPSPWTYESHWDLSGGTASFDGGVWGAMYQTDANMAISIEANTTYTFSVDITTSGTARFSIVGVKSGVAYTGKNNLSAGRFTVEFISPSDIGAGGLKISGYADSDPFVMDDISLIKNATIGDDPYYVAVDGDDKASGDINNPWATWEKAARVAYAGDTIYFRGGVYYFTESISLTEASTTTAGDTAHNGTYGNNICYFGYPPDIANGDSVIFDFSNNYIEEPDIAAMDSLYALGESTSGMGSENGGFAFNWMNYFHLKDFVVRNVYQKYLYSVARGMFFYGSQNFTLERLTVHTIGGHGISGGTTSGVDSTYIINCDVYRCIDSLSASPGNLADGYAGSWGVGIFMVPSFSNQYMEITGCRVWDNADDGFNIVPYGRSIITNTWSFENGVYIEDIGDGVTSMTTGGNAYKLNSANQSYERLSGQDTINHYVRNCIAAFNNGVAYKDNHTSGSPTLGRVYYNNIAYSNSHGVVNTNACGLEPCKPTEVYNHIGLGNPNGEMNEVNYGVVDIHLNNTWDAATGVTVNADDFLYGLDSLTISTMLKAPRNADGSLPTNPFTLAEGSDLIDAGTPDIATLSSFSIIESITYNGAAPDLGPIESDYFPGTDNKYPIVEITSPSSGRIYQKKTSLTIKVNATDDGGISTLELYNSDTLLSESTESSLSYKWDLPPDGKFLFRAVATDNLGAKATSSLATIIIDSNHVTDPVNDKCFEVNILGNVTSDYFNLQIPNKLPVDNYLSIISLNGRVVLKVKLFEGEVDRKIDVKDLTTGIYFIKFDNNEGYIPCNFDLWIVKK